MKKSEKRYNGNMHMEECLSEEYLSGNENNDEDGSYNLS